MGAFYGSKIKNGEINSKPGEPWTIEKGEFAVFFPGEGAHAPCLTVDGSRFVRKVVIKVRAKAPAPF